MKTVNFIEKINLLEGAIKRATTVEQCVLIGKEMSALRLEILKAGCYDDLYEGEYLDECLSEIDELDSEAQDKCQEIMESNRKVAM